MTKNNQFDQRYLAFGASVVKYISQLPANKGGAHIGDQLFRSSTSVGAHLQEARAAESRADFIHKLSMSLKEMREAKYWLELILETGFLSGEGITNLLQESDELVAILTRSVITAKNKNRGPHTSDRAPETYQISHVLRATPEVSGEPYPPHTSDRAPET